MRALFQGLQSPRGGGNLELAMKMRDRVVDWPGIRARCAPFASAQARHSPVRVCNPRQYSPDQVARKTAPDFPGPR